MAQTKGRIELGESRTNNETRTLMVAQEVVGRDVKRNISNKAKLNEFSNNFRIKKLLLGFHQTKKASYKEIGLMKICSQNSKQNMRNKVMKRRHI